MATIASPRLASPSGHSTPTSSRRTSLDTASAASPARGAPPTLQPRRNRAALRDYYGLKNAVAPDTASADSQNDDIHVKESELDREGFDAQKYVQEVLRREGLEGVLRTEGELLSDIKGLDGERKALVYDNYSKLITATDTISKMRMNMEPLDPANSTLSPIVAHIAETATSVATGLKERTKEPSSPTSTKAKEQQRETVRWALDTPRRLMLQLQDGERQAAMEDWDEINRLLTAWEGTKGVDELRQKCLDILKLEDAEDKDT